MAPRTSIPVTGFAPPERVPLELVRRQAATLLEQPLTAELLNSVLDYVFILNPQRQIVFASKNVLELTGEKDAECVLGLRPGEALGCVHAGEGPAGCGTTEFCTECGAAQAILAGLAGEAGTRECRITRLIDSAPQALDLRVAATPFLHQGKRYCILAVADISDQKRRRAWERLFFHDLINWASGLGGLMEALVADAPDRLRSDLEVAHEAFNELLEQIQSQKELVAAERDELEVSPSALDPAAELDQVSRVYAAHPLARQREIRIARIARNLTVRTDRKLLRRILGNLLKNALEASEPKEVITIGCERAGRGVRFMVHNAAFMPREVQLQVFNRSFSTRGPGRGLGTYSVKLLTEQCLRGTVTFSTTPAAGTTFFVTLPLTI